MYGPNYLSSQQTPDDEVQKRFEKTNGMNRPGKSPVAVQSRIVKESEGEWGFQKGKKTKEQRTYIGTVRRPQKIKNSGKGRHMGAASVGPAANCLGELSGEKGGLVRNKTGRGRFFL